MFRKVLYFNLNKPFISYSKTAFCSNNNDNQDSNSTKSKKTSQFVNFEDFLNKDRHKSNKRHRENKEQQTQTNSTNEENVNKENKEHSHNSNNNKKDYSKDFDSILNISSMSSKLKEDLHTFRLNTNFETNELRKKFLELGNRV